MMALAESQVGNKSDTFCGDMFFQTATESEVPLSVEVSKWRKGEICLLTVALVLPRKNGAI